MVADGLLQLMTGCRALSNGLCRSWTQK